MKLLATEVRNAIKVLTALEKAPDYIQQTIDYLNNAESLKDYLPKAKTFNVARITGKGKTDIKAGVKLARMIDICGERCAVHKNGGRFILSHYPTGVQLKGGFTRQTLVSLIEETKEKIKNIGRETFISKTKQFDVIN